MSLITRMRKQKAVYWKRTTNDRFMTYSFEAPVEIDCRWEDRDVELNDSQGLALNSKSIVYVDRAMEPGDVLLLGELTEAHADYVGGSGDSPETLEGAFSIKQFDTLPNLKATENLYTAHL